MKLSTAATAMIVSATMLSFPAEVAAKKTNDKFEATDERLKVLELEKKIEVVDIKMDEVKSMIAQLLEQKQSASSFESIEARQRWQPQHVYNESIEECQSR